MLVQPQTGVGFRAAQSSAKIPFYCNTTFPVFQPPGTYSLSYSLAVSFEIVGREIPIHDDLRVAAEEM